MNYKFEKIIDNPPSLQNPFVCKIVEFIDYDRNQQHAICIIEDDYELKAIGFFYKKFAEIISDPIVKSRIPFNITIIKGNAQNLNGKIIFEIYQVVFEKNTLINSSSLGIHGFCPTQTYLNNFVNTEDDLNANQLFGNLIHSYLGNIFNIINPINKLYSTQELSSLVKDAFLKAIYNNWQFLTAAMVSEKQIYDAFIKLIFNQELEFIKYEIEKLIETNDRYVFQSEKMIRSKNFGIQGRIDRLLWNQSKNTFTIYETKTGKSSAASSETAKFQLISYCIVLKEYYQNELEELILEYPRNELKERLKIIDYDEEIFLKLLAIRNEVWAISVGKRPENGPYMHCSRCWSKEICSFYCLRSFLTRFCISCENCKYHSILVNKKDFEDFRKYNVYFDWFSKILQEEYLQNLKLLSEINLDAEQREKLGNCIGNLIIKEIITKSDTKNEFENTRLMIKLARVNISGQDKTFSDFTGTRLNKGDYILITPQEYKPLTVESYPAIIETIFSEELIISMGSDILLEISKYPPNTIFRIDSSVSNINLNLERTALDVFLRKPYNIENKNLIKIRDILVNNQKNDSFIGNISKKITEALNSFIIECKKDLENKKFNKEQIESILACLDFEGLKLIQGPPGTGKTTVLVEITKYLIKKINLLNPMLNQIKQEQTGKKDSLNRDKQELDPIIENFTFEIKKIHKKLLISAYTNRALDNIIEKIQETYPSLNIVRIGSESSITKTVYKNSLEDKCKEIIKLNSGEEISVNSPTKAIDFLKKADIIAATCFGSGSLILSNFSFEYVLIDEAAQVLEPIALIPLMKGNNVILVGDDQQLPPITQNNIYDPSDILKHLDDTFFLDKSYLKDFNSNFDLSPAIDTLMDEKKRIFLSELEKMHFYEGDKVNISIFERLKKIYGKSDKYHLLKEQYRMNKVISDFISENFYESKLIPAVVNGKDIGNRTLSDYMNFLNIPFYQNLSNNNEELFKFIFDFNKPLVFCDTKLLNAKDSKMESRFEDLVSKFNEIEAEFIVIVTKTYLKLARSLINLNNIEVITDITKNIGIITPYRAQVKLIQQKLYQSYSNDPDFLKIIQNNLIIDTVDKFQGQESEIILISLVDSNDEHEFGEIHNELRRLNVSLTRAKTKAIIVGNSKMFWEHSQNSLTNIVKEKKSTKKPKNLLDYVNDINNPPIDAFADQKSINNIPSKPIKRILNALTDYCIKNQSYIEIRSLNLNMI